MKKVRNITILAICLLVFGFLPAQAQDIPLADTSLCQAEIDQVEKGSRIPAQMLKAISMVESGRWDKKAKRIVPWPWTVMARGEGKFFENRHQAINYVKGLLMAGIRNIDIGCMQINWQYHGDKFPSIESMFEPQYNVRYAAKFLIDLKETHRSWTQAIAHYHSSTTKFNRPYKKRVFDSWSTARKQAYEDRRRQVLANYLKRKQERAQVTSSVN